MWKGECGYQGRSHAVLSHNDSPSYRFLESPREIRFWKAQRVPYDSTRSLSRGGD